MRRPTADAACRGVLFSVIGFTDSALSRKAFSDLEGKTAVVAFCSRITALYIVNQNHFFQEALCFLIIHICYRAVKRIVRCLKLRRKHNR